MSLYIKELCYALSACEVMRIQFEPALWQTEFLTSPHPRLQLLCPRQTGKSECIAAKSIQKMLLFPGRPVLVISPTEKQSKENIIKAKIFLRSIHSVQMKKDSETKIELDTGSRMIALSGTEVSVRGYSNPSLIALDEAARLDDDIYMAVEPILAQDSQFVMASTPAGEQGFFFDAYENSPTHLEDPYGWHKIKVDIYQCPYRYSEQWIASKKNDPLLGERAFAQEYMCEFVKTVEQLFDPELIAAAFSDEVEAIIL